MELEVAIYWVGYVGDLSLLIVYTFEVWVTRWISTFRGCYFQLHGFISWMGVVSLIVDLACVLSCFL